MLKKLDYLINTVDKKAHPDKMGTWKANKHSDQRSFIMNVKKTLSTVVVWYDANTGKVSLAKCNKTGKFVSLAVAQGLLNVEMNAFRVPCTPTIKVNYSILAMVVFVVATMLSLGVTTLVIGLAVHASLTVAALFALLIPAFAGLAVISAEECVTVRV